MEIKLEQADISHLQELQKIGKTTFNETFSEQNTAENMAAYLETGFSSERLSEEMNAVGSAFYLAKENNRIIGYLKINFGDNQTELKEEKALEIERIYVLKAYHGQLVGQLILEFALQLAIKNHCNYVWLGVWEENPRAIRFYEKNGFVAFDKHIFTLGDDEQTDIMMRLKLNAS